MSFANPLALAGLLLLGIILRCAGLRLPTKSPTTKKVPVSKRLRILSGLRIAIIILAILALADLSIKWPTRNRRIVMLFDVSESIAKSQVEAARRSAIELLGRLRPEDRVALLAFAGKTRLISPLAGPEETKAILESAELMADHLSVTNLCAALSAGAKVLKSPRGNRSMILFSDGRSTSGAKDSDLLKEAAGVAVYPIPIGISHANIVTEQLVFPEGLRAGEIGGVRWRVWSNQTRDVTVRLRTNGRLLAQRTLELKAGRSNHDITLPPMESGVYPVDFEVLDRMTGEKKAGANSGGIVAVEGPAKVLLVGETKKTWPLARVLEIQGFTVIEEPPEHLPETPGGLSPYAAVVFDNVSARSLTEKQSMELQDYVASGGGFLVIGGDTSLGRGDYYLTALEEILPVHTDTRQRLRFSRANILFIIDRSGSMGETIGDISKQLAAMKGIVASLDDLNPQDEVGILSFSSRPSWVLPFTPVAEREKIKKAIENMERGGGTEMSAALEEATRGFAGRGPVRRHVVLLSDGVTDINNLKKFCDQLKTMGASITTIGIGSDINEPLLKSVARWGGGSYYRAESETVPQVMVKETARVTRDLIQEGLFMPVIHDKDALLSGLEVLPPIKGYLLAKPKPMASVALKVGEDDPLLATWRYGSGRVTVFTSDSGKRWLSPWLGSPIFNRFWGQLVRSVQRNQPDGGLRIKATAEGDHALIVVEALAPDGRLRLGRTLQGRHRDGSGDYFILEEKVPGRYEAKIPLLRKGCHLFEVRELPTGNWKASGVWNPPGQEIMITGPDMASLFQLASSGRMMTLKTLKPPPPVWAWELIRLRTPLIIFSIIIFLLELGLRSLALGQMKGIREAMADWRNALNRQIEAARGRREQAYFTSNRSNDAAAQRYLAERLRQRHHPSDNTANKR